jgi:hypothetical protein
MGNVIKFQSPFERIKLYNESPEVMLCKAILMQAIIDTTNTSNDKEAKKLEIEAKAWIFGSSSHFYEICCAVNMEPSFVVKITKQLINLQKNKKSAAAHNIQDISAVMGQMASI